MRRLCNHSCAMEDIESDCPSADVFSIPQRIFSDDRPSADRTRETDALSCEDSSRLFVHDLEGEAVMK